MKLGHGRFRRNMTDQNFCLPEQTPPTKTNRLNKYLTNLTGTIKKLNRSLFPLKTKFSYLAWIEEIVC